MWQKMMRIWLMGAAVTVGSLDGLPDALVAPAAIRGDGAAETVADFSRDNARDDGADADAAAAPPQPIST